MEKPMRLSESAGEHGESFQSDRLASSSLTCTGLPPGSTARARGR